MEIFKEEKFYGFRKTDAENYVWQMRNDYSWLTDNYTAQGIEAFEETDDDNVALVILENGTWLLVHDDGTAVDPHGRVYVCVSKEVESKPLPADNPLVFPCTIEEMDEEPPETFPIPDTDLVTLGWTPDADKPVIITEHRE